MVNQYALPLDDKKARVAQALAKAKARSKEIAARPDLDRPRRDLDWADVGKSAATGVRSGLESTAGMGDISTTQQDAAAWLMRKMGLGDTAADLAKTATKYTSPFSLLPTSEQVGGVTDATFGGGDITRHTSTTPQGENIASATNLLSGLVGGPENFGKDVALKLGMSMVPAAKLAGKGASKIGREALTEAKAAKKLAKVEEDPFAVDPEAFDPYAVRTPEKAPATPAAAPPEPAPSSIIRPTPDEIAQVQRPPQERSGVFDYSFKMPVRESGVTRYNPPRGVPERTTDLLGRRDVFDKMVAGVERGLPVKDWYEFGPVYKSFVDQFGEEAGTQKFDQFVNSIASTSPRSDVGTNIRNASYYYGQAQPRPGQNSIPGINDLPLKAPQPYGHLAQKLHRMNVEKTVFPGGEGFDPIKNPKPLSFAWNFKGDPNLVTVDTHAFRAPAMLGEDPRFLETSFLNKKGAEPRNIMQEHAEGKVPMSEATQRGAFWQSVPKENEYGAWENYYRKIAQELGITPAEAQASGWVGHGPLTGLESAPKSAMDFVEERILLTAKKLGKDPKDVWRDAITGKTPLLTLGGASLGAGALMDREGDQP